jgi:membrane peptidoglycan carboxypeptidase
VTRPTPNPRPNPYLTVLKLVAIIVVAAVLCAGVLLPYVGGIGLAARTEADRFLDTTCDLQETPPPVGTTLYASDGKTPIATIFEQNRKPVPLTMIPTYLQQALVDTEDRRFFQHHGVDIRSLIRSAFSTSGGDTQGGSTLTMQYVKQSRYYKDIGNAAKQDADISQTISRKLQDAKCAIELEKRESKDTILDNYLNIAFFGENAYSVESAALTYFGTTVNKLTLPQSAMLVGILRAPTSYDPFQHRQAATDRRNQVIENMVTAHDLTEAQAQVYEASPVSLSTPTPPTVEQGCYNAPDTVKNVGFFCDYVENWLENTEGISEPEIMTGGLKIVTTLNVALQDSAQEQISARFPATSPTTALMPMVDPATGNVLAMVSSKKYGFTAGTSYTSNPIFTAYNADAASTYKYFTTVAALTAGAPPSLKISNNTPDKKGYTPLHCPAGFTAQNDDQNESYPQTEDMAQALAKSSNTYFVGLEDGLFGCDLTPILDTINNLGMKNLTRIAPGSNQTYEKQIIAQDQAGLTLGFYQTSPLELTSAYATAANDGIYCPPAPVLSITDQANKQVKVQRTPCSQEMTPQVARETTDLLTGDTEPGGTSAAVFGNWYQGNSSQVAGKTGTDTAVVTINKTPESLNTSFWFVGMTQHIVATMAMMNVTNPEAPVKGIPGLSDAAAETTADGSTAAALWLAALQPTLKSQHWSWPSPDAVAGSVPVPNVIGQPVNAAIATLEQRGFKAVTMATECGSAQLQTLVAYYSPQSAAPGTTVTICISTGTAPYIYKPPPVLTKPPSTPPPSGAGSGSGTGTPTNPRRGGPPIGPPIVPH